MEQITQGYLFLYITLWDEIERSILIFDMINIHIPLLMLVNINT